MDSSLKIILVSSFCSVIFKNNHNFRVAFAEYSVQPILHFLEKEIKHYQTSKKNDEYDYCLDVCNNEKPS